ncbi:MULTISPECIES: hypothetical protein [unclassified Duganella]|uniref:hypothetical protein n=1 Tax=unclassified Duganella TaxID=2636909 RepID=UPI000A95DD41|nr:MULTISPECIES: hypothetical protein [unclassified Duganella]
MTKIQNSPATAPVIQVQVVATPEIDPTSKKVKYITTFTPEKIKATQPDTILSYELVTPTPSGVKFKSVKVTGKKPEQISPPTISQSGKVMVLTDANTFREVLSLTIRFKDSDAVEFDVDPEVENDPGEFESHDSPAPTVMREPEVGNDPGE